MRKASRARGRNPDDVRKVSWMVYKIWIYACICAYIHVFVCFIRTYIYIHTYIGFMQACPSTRVENSPRNLCILMYVRECIHTHIHTCTVFMQACPGTRVENSYYSSILDGH
jgi:hypothetical protein